MDTDTNDGKALVGRLVLSPFKAGKSALKGLGLVPEERWWLYTMTAAQTAHYAKHNVGWRRAIRYALTENPVVMATPCFHGFDVGSCLPPTDPTFCVPTMFVCT